ncbi:hypothetical protein [Parablautia muri]|uniref:Uncharacterized protein n=1 Tax=Parablautia muri TaxID=2320879 RepID=A0A9X5BIF7_9FIRM|nr:hypothetical protein [Parablautia muri]NBJ94535.1 hypothetical protein [Parablautia muri]
MQKELIYDKVNGFLTDGMPSLLEGAVIEDEFAEGKECCLLYEGVYQAGRNLCERLGEDEDSDVETILNGMERITRLVSMKMYEYGRREAGIAI